MNIVFYNIMLKYKKFVFDKSLKLFNTINLAYLL